MLAPPHLRYVGVGWIYCTGRLLTHRRAGGEIAVSCLLEGSCVQNAAMAAGAITRSRGWLYRPYKYEFSQGVKRWPVTYSTPMCLART